jgi:hypothetical protein
MPTTAQLERGMIVRDVLAHTPEGRQVYASDFRGRRNLVLIFPGQDKGQSGVGR